MAVFSGQLADCSQQKADGSGQLVGGSGQSADSSQQIADGSQQIADGSQQMADSPQLTTHNPQLTTHNSQPTTDNSPKVSAFSLSGLKAKKVMLQSSSLQIKETENLPTESFTATEMLGFWYKYADRLSDKGHKIMESLLRMNEPKLDGFKISYELPNEGSRIEFETEKNQLLGYLRGHLHNHDIDIELIVNEKIENKFAFTDIDKYNRLKEINPHLELLKKVFELDF